MKESERARAHTTVPSRSTIKFCSCSVTDSATPSRACNSAIVSSWLGWCTMLPRGVANKVLPAPAAAAAAGVGVSLAARPRDPVAEGGGTVRFNFAGGGTAPAPPRTGVMSTSVSGLSLSATARVLLPATATAAAAAAAAAAVSTDGNARRVSSMRAATNKLRDSSASRSRSCNRSVNSAT